MTMFKYLEPSLTALTATTAAVDGECLPVKVSHSIRLYNERSKILSNFLKPNFHIYLAHFNLNV